MIKKTFCRRASLIFMMVLYFGPLITTSLTSVHTLKHHSSSNNTITRQARGILYWSWYTERGEVWVAMSLPWCWDAPFGMVQWSPDTVNKPGSGYDYNDNRIKGSQPDPSSAVPDVLAMTIYSPLHLMRRCSNNSPASRPAIYLNLSHSKRDRLCRILQGGTSEQWSYGLN